MTECVVYWLHSDTHVDPHTQGYVGVATNLQQRLYNHLRDARLRKHVNDRLASFLEETNYYIVTILFMGHKADCYNREKRLRPTKNIGLNIAAGGKGGSTTLGMSMPVSHREKRRLYMMGNKLARGNHKSKSASHRKNIGLSNKGKVRTDSQKLKQSIAMKGRRHSPEHNQKIGECLRGKVWWNDRRGNETKATERPGIDWIRGRAKKTDKSVVV